MRKHRNHIDLSILICVLTLMVLSLGVVYSASSSWAEYKFGGSERLLGSHTIKVLIGFTALFVFMNIDYKKYRKLTKPVLLGTVLLLAGTLALGGEVKGAARWLRFGGMGFQPSELAKYALIFHLCVLLVQKKDKLGDFKTGYLPLVIWTGLVTVLVILQPNFSTAAMILTISLILLFIGKVRISHLALTVAPAIPLMIGYMLSAPYRMQRVMNFFNGGGDASGGGNYQLRQGIIGFGNGGIFGLGPGESRQRDLYLPESYGDFVFSIVGEEYGLIGTLFFMAVFLVIMLRGFRIAKHAPDEFGRLLALGITLSVTMYALVNAGVTLGILPTTGLPMPFVSYGGSSIVFSAAAIGVLLNISSQTDMYPRLVQSKDSVSQSAGPQAAVAGKAY